MISCTGKLKSTVYTYCSLRTSSERNGLDRIKLHTKSQKHPGIVISTYMSESVVTYDSSALGI